MIALVLILLLFAATEALAITLGKATRRDGS
jgi:hypothetical protein